MTARDEYNDALNALTTRWPSTCDYCGVKGENASLVLLVASNNPESSEHYRYWEISVCNPCLKEHGRELIRGRIDLEMGEQESPGPGDEVLALFRD